VWNTPAETLNKALAAGDLPVRVANLGSIWTMTYRIPSCYNWMLQFYLRTEGIRLSWIGTGRLIFSHSFTDDQFMAVAARIVAAANRMKGDGWWWHEPGLTNRRIRWRLAREMVAALARAR